MLFRLANSGRFCYGREEMGGDRREWYGMEGNRRGERESKGGNLRGMDGNGSEGRGGRKGIGEDGKGIGEDGKGIGEDGKGMGSKGRGGNEIEGKVRRREWYGMRGHRRGGEETVREREEMK